jgi:hypothetical protein
LRPFNRLHLAPAITIATLGLALTMAPLSASAASTPSGMVAFGQSTVEPALNDANGSIVFLLTPNKAPFPSLANAAHAVAPLYLPLYPVGSTVDPNLLNCRPTNCDHAQSFVYPIIGHDHVIGVNPTGDFNVAWHVVLIAFTPQAFGDGAINIRLTTHGAIEAAEQAGDVVEISTPITFNCSIVSKTVFDHGTPLTFPLP